MKTYWKPLKGKKAYHCWNDDSGELQVISICNQRVYRRSIESNPPQLTDEMKCKNCTRALKR